MFYISNWLRVIFDVNCSERKNEKFFPTSIFYEGHVESSKKYIQNRDSDVVEEMFNKIVARHNDDMKKYIESMYFCVYSFSFPIISKTWRSNLLPFHVNRNDCGSFRTPPR